MQPGVHYGMAVHPDGRIMLTPMALIPQRELILRENPQLHGSVLRGIDDVRAGRTSPLDLDDLDVDDDGENDDE